MSKADPMYSLIETIFGAKEVVVLLGGEISVEGRQTGESFPCFEELIHTILRDSGFKPEKNKKKRLEKFLGIIQTWEKERIITEKMKEYLDGKPSLAHYLLAALSIALISISNARLYLTTCYDDLMSKAFRDLEDNPERTFKVIDISLPTHQTVSNIQKNLNSIDGHLKRGRPVVLKLFGDLNSNSPIFRQDELLFQPQLERKLVEWMKKPIIVIGYSFSDKIIEKLFSEAESISPIFLVNSSKEIPASIKRLKRIHQIESRFPDFMSDLFELIGEKNKSIRESAEKILGFLEPQPVQSDSQQPIDKIETDDFPKNLPKKKEIDEEIIGSTQPHFQTILVRKILILASAPSTAHRLYWNKEVKRIKKDLRQSKYRDYFKIESEWDLDPGDFLTAMLDHDPHIVHYTGHGKAEGLLVDDGMDFATLISTQALSSLFKQFSKKVECVILSSCYSAPQADAIKQHIDCVIGMQKDIEDDAATEFAVGFYKALGAGKSYKEAYEIGKVAVQMKFADQTHHLIPVFK